MISRRQLEVQQQELVDLQNKYSRTLADNDKLEQDFRNLQERSFNALTDARWMPLDESFIQGQITRIRNSIWELARRYAAESIASLDSADEIVQLAVRKSLEHVVRFSQDGPTAVLELTTIKHAPRLLLAAIISHSVHRDVLTKPFFFLNDGLDRDFEGLRQDELVRGRRNADRVFIDTFTAVQNCQ